MNGEVFALPTSGVKGGVLFFGLFSAILGSSSTPTSISNYISPQRYTTTFFLPPRSSLLEFLLKKQKKIKMDELQKLVSGGFGSGGTSAKNRAAKKPAAKAAKKWGASLSSSTSTTTTTTTPTPSTPTIPSDDTYNPEVYPPNAIPTAITTAQLILPVTQRIKLSAHSRPVSALCLDPQASMLLTGGLDYRVNHYEFASMDSGLRSAKEHEPHEGYPVNGLSFAPSGEQYVVSISHLRPMIFSRAGRELAEFVAGDMYVVQENATRGHTALTNSVKWLEDNTILTSSNDGTVRIWDPEEVETRQKTTFLHGKKNGKKARCTFADLNGPKRAIISGGDDGMVNIWQRNARFTRPSLSIAAHGAKNVVTCVASSADGRYLASRGEEGGVKLWDTRNTSKVVAERTLECFYDNTSIVFGHGDKVLATGSGADPRDGTHGRLVLMDAQNMNVVRDVPVGVGSVSQIVWSSAVNQIFVGSQDGNCHVFYDPVASNGGVMPALQRRKRHVAHSTHVGEILCPQSEKDIHNAIEAAENPRQQKRTRSDTYNPVAQNKKQSEAGQGVITAKQAYVPIFFLLFLRRNEPPGVMLPIHEAIREPEQSLNRHLLYLLMSTTRGAFVVFKFFFLIRSAELQRYFLRGPTSIFFSSNTASCVSTCRTWCRRPLCVTKTLYLPCSHTRRRQNATRNT